MFQLILAIGVYILIRKHFSKMYLNYQIKVTNEQLLICDEALCIHH